MGNEHQRLLHQVQRPKAVACVLHALRNLRCYQRQAAPDEVPAAEGEDMKGTCIRCGKPFRSVDDIHTCTPPRALVLADELETKGEALGCSFDRHSAELRRLHADNEQLAEFVVAVGGFWGHSKSKLVGEDSLAECIDGCIEQNEQLRQQKDELLGTLKHARDLVAEWGAHASAYEKERYGLALDIKQLNAAIQRAEMKT
jgi:hypothetical protein